MRRHPSNRLSRSEYPLDWSCCPWVAWHRQRQRSHCPAPTCWCCYTALVWPLTPCRWAHRHTGRWCRPRSPPSRRLPPLTRCSPSALAWALLGNKDIEEREEEWPNEQHKSCGQVTGRRTAVWMARVGWRGSDAKHRASILRLDARCDEKRQQRRALNHSEWQHWETPLKFLTPPQCRPRAIAPSPSHNLCPHTYRMCKQPSDTFWSLAGTECQRYSHRPPGCSASARGKFASQFPWRRRQGKLRSKKRRGSREEKKRQKV